MEMTVIQDTATLDDAGFVAEMEAIMGPLALLQLNEIQTMVDGVVASWQKCRSPLQNRRWHRFPCDRLVAVTPVDDQTHEPNGPTMVAQCSDLSQGGIALVHRDALPYRHLAITFEEFGLKTALVALKWCRFTKDGTYKSGGRLLRKMVTPSAAQADWSEMPSA